jgi:membrane protein implicated in regulation of membrane protease activity
VFTVLGFSMGFLALGAVVAVVEVLMTVLAIAFFIYASLALTGVVVFSVIGIRRVLARRHSEQGQPQMTQLQGAYNEAGRIP